MRLCIGTLVLSAFSLTKEATAYRFCAQRVGFKRFYGLRAHISCTGMWVLSDFRVRGLDFCAQACRFSEVLVNTHVNTLVDTLVNTCVNTHVNTLVNILVNTLMNTNMNTLVNTRVRTLVNAHVNNLVNTFVNTRVNSSEYFSKYSSEYVM